MSPDNALLLVRADGQPVETLFTRGPLSADDPFAECRDLAYSGADGVAAGIVQASGVWRSEQYPCTEMLVVHRGRLSVQIEGKTLEAGPGHSLVIGAGVACSIEAAPDSLWAFCAMTQAQGPTPPGLSWIDRYLDLSPSAAPEATILIGPAPQCRAHNAFEDPGSSLRIGVWDSTPYTRSARPHKVHELMHLIEGHVLLSGADGVRVQVNTGDSVFVPLGAPCAWQSKGYVRKFYAVG